MHEEFGYDDSYEADEVEYYAIRPNKTQIKRDIAELFSLGEEISRLSATQLLALELPGNIQKALAQVSGMPLNGARKRLLKYIAAQLHKIDVTPIREKLARLQNKSVHVAREHHIVERWRNRLITEGNEALTELLEAYPEADRQQIRQLIRNIQKEQAAAKPPKSFRQLYRYLRELFNFSADFEAEDSSIAAPNEESEI